MAINRYSVFAIPKSGPRGGWWDFIASTTTLAAAQARCEKLVSHPQYLGGHVADTTTGTIVFKTGSHPDGLTES